MRKTIFAVAAGLLMLVGVGRAQLAIVPALQAAYCGGGKGSLCNTSKTEVCVRYAVSSRSIGLSSAITVSCSEWKITTTYEYWDL